MPADEREIAQWYVMLSEEARHCIFSALSSQQRRQAFVGVLTVNWQRLPDYAKALVIDEWHVRQAEIRKIELAAQEEKW
jgi:predicted Fe-S protein YdhL (DUF1289 family)